MKRLIVALLLVLGARAAEGQVDSCLSLYEKVLGDSLAIINPDSVKLDTCEDEVWYYQNEPRALFARHPFRITFKYFILKDSINVSGDTVNQDWRAIPPQFGSIRAWFDSIESHLGRLTLRRLNEPSADTGNKYSKAYHVFFERYVNVDTACSFLVMLPELDENEPFGFDGGPFFESTVKPTNSMVRLICSTANVFNIEVSTIDGVKVYDGIGRIILIPMTRVSENTISIDFSTTERGIYYISSHGRTQPVVIWR